MPKHPKTIVLDNFKGLNNVLSPDRTPPDYLKEALNVDIDKSGGIDKREGYTQKDTGNWTALWSEDSRCFGVKDGQLVSVSEQYNVTELGHLVGTSPVSFAHVDGRTHYVSDTTTGIIHDDGLALSTFGIDRPNPRPSLAVAPTGSLEQGTYQVALTYVDDRGLESGSGVASLINVGEGQGIEVESIAISNDPRVTHVNIYCSTPNGEVLYFIGRVVNGISSTTITSIRHGVLPLKSFNVFPAPTGHIIRYAHSRLWIAQGSTLWYSDPLSYEWFRFQEAFLPFPERIRAVMPTAGGMWIASDKLYYLAGQDPVKAKLTEKEPVKVVEGTDRKIVGAYIFFENTPIGYKWLVTTDKGMYVCFNDGVTLNMTERNVVFPEADKGTGLFIQKEGINRYLSILQKRADTDNARLGDQVTAQIIRNGVPIQ